MSLFSQKPTPPHLTLPSNDLRNISYDANNTPPNKQLRSPGGSKLGTFFGWGGNTSPVSSTTTFSDEIRSPSSPEKSLPVTRSASTSNRVVPAVIDTEKANAGGEGYFGNSFLNIPSPIPGTPGEVEEMEAELKTITADLATSIRREMELEDLVDRLQADAANPTGPGRRTSDYFSDSGTSSVKYGGEQDVRTEEMEKLQRRTEREKAQIRVDLTEKVQEERSRRKVLETQVRQLEERASHVDLASMNSLDAGGRLKDLELTCEDLRRRLNEERQVKENFEDLLTALKSELHTSHNERDNLRDEIVPQLRARVEGLEAQAAEHEKLAYESTKMQQQMQTLQNENQSLVAARKQSDMQQQMNKFNSIVEEPQSNRSRSIGLTRSNTVTQGSNIRDSRSSLSRSTSVKGSGESRDALAERVKDVEAQRDALHRALKSLLERQEHQNRENDKRIRQLEMERDRAVTNSPRRMGYDREVSNLREEINTLRRRADEAIEQKWQCEKGLSGLKMDLDRAEQEISSLRQLLHENGVPAPEGINGSKPILLRRNSSASEALEQAYRNLQEEYSKALDRMKNLEKSMPTDEDTAAALAQLQSSLAVAISERDFAHQEADTYRLAAASHQSAEKHHVASEVALADELRTSAKRVESLAVQVRQQLASNATLRQRLSETIERGEKEQKANAGRIVFMQGKLKNLEDALMTAQQASEERVTKHEEEIRILKESHNTQLLRVKDGIKSPRSFAPKSPMSPLFAGSVPRLDRTTSGQGMSFGEQTKTEVLKKRVVELEKALEEADKEMEEVVGRMNVAQIEVMELQNEREDAVRMTRKLKAQLEDERVKGFEQRFQSLSS